jgi:predicted secreted hydrolase
VRRREFLGVCLLPLSNPSLATNSKVVKNKVFSFPRDDGSHPDFRTEWWYLTGWLDDAVGFQVTFFRFRPVVDEANPSAFNPRGILVAHAALADPKRGRLLHEERAARAGFSLAEAEESRTSLWIDDWRLDQQGDRYHARIPGMELDFDLSLPGRQTVLQGEGGFSRKGARPQEASYYYSRPHLEVSGKVNGRDVKGSAWLDHEWSSAYLAPEAVGWDWCGINLFDGGSLMAFRMRKKGGGIYYADAGTSFEVLRTWKSPRTGTEYPIEMKVTSGKTALRLVPLMDDQELDARASTGTIYWEGAVRAFDGAKEVGRGYLELTGYWKPMKL